MTELAFPKPSRFRDRRFLNSLKDQRCAVCNLPPGHPFNPIDPSHLISRGAGGPDSAWNVVAMCRNCHDKWEVNWSGIVAAVRSFKRKLEAMGWEILDSVGKPRLWHPKLRGE